MAAWGLGSTSLVRRVFPHSCVLRVPSYIPGVQGHGPIGHRVSRENGNGIAMRVKQLHVAYQVEIRNILPWIQEINTHFELFRAMVVGM